MFTALAAEGGNALVTAMQGVDFSAIGDTISAVVPVALPVIVGVLAIRKGISFLIGCIHLA